MLYIKPSEIAEWAPRVSVAEEQLRSKAAIATESIKAYLGRPLEYAEFTRTVRLNAGLVGYFGPAPVSELLAVRVRRVRRLVGGGSAPSFEGWVDMDVADVEPGLDRRLGKITLYSPVWDGYNRFTTELQRTLTYDAEIEFESGYLRTTEADEEAAAGTRRVRVASTKGFLPGMRVTVGDETTRYRIASVVDGEITLASDLAASVEAGDEVSEVVPDDVKAACGAIIEDLETYLPNAAKQSRKLSVITDTVERTSASPIPPQAALFLAKYAKA